MARTARYIPLSDKTRNNGFYNRWTCPACYDDLPDKEPGLVTCPSCKARVELTLDYEPVSIATLLTEDDA